MKGFAKDVFQLLNTRFQVSFYSIDWSEKDICGRVECVLARWIREYVCFFIATFGKYELRINCDSGTGIGRQRLYDGKQVVHPYWLLTEVVWWCRQYEV